MAGPGWCPWVAELGQGSGYPVALAGRLPSTHRSGGGGAAAVNRTGVLASYRWEPSFGYVRRAMGGTGPGGCEGHYETTPRSGICGGCGCGVRGRAGGGPGHAGRLGCPGRQWGGPGRGGPGGRVVGPGNRGARPADGGRPVSSINTPRITIYGWSTTSRCELSRSLARLSLTAHYSGGLVRIGWRAAATGVLLAGTLITAVPGSASARARPNGTDASAPRNVFTGVAATSPANAWIVGTTEIGIDPVHTLIVHWNGKTWQRVPSPGAAGRRTSSYLNAVAATSRRNAWAVGESNIKALSSLTEHWNGTAWKVVPSPSPKGVTFLNAVAARTVNDAWAVGLVIVGPGSNSRTLIEHWNGKSWVRVPSPSFTKAPRGTQVQNSLNSVAEISASNVWAVGDYIVGSDAAQTLIEHWNGTKWTIIPSPVGLVNPNFLNAIAAVSPTDLFAVGGLGDFAFPTATMIFRWQGTKWRLVPSLTNDNAVQALGAVSAVSASDVWAVGASQSQISSKNPPLILRWNGRKWQTVRTPLPSRRVSVSLVSVAAVSAKVAWAVGSSTGASGPAEPLILRWNGARWVSVAVPRL